MTQEIAAASPAPDDYTARIVRGDFRKRLDLPPRDRSIATLAALVARNRTAF